jgi:hypothetical protein
MAQHTQRDEVGHIQNTADAEALAYPRQGALHGREQFGEHRLVGEAVHQCVKAIGNHGGSDMLRFCNKKSPHPEYLLSSAFYRMKNGATASDRLPPPPRRLDANLIASPGVPVSAPTRALIRQTTRPWELRGGHRCARTKMVTDPNGTYLTV